MNKNAVRNGCILLLTLIFILKILMLIGGKNKAKKKARRSNSVRGTQRFTRPSQANGGANIPINSEIAIPKLEKLAQKYIGVSDPYGFLTDLRNALGIPNSQGASKYGEVTIPKNDGSVLQASLRITNHNSDARTYITHNANYEYNLSILVRKNFAANRFKPHDDVRLDEFVYYGKRMEKVENPLSQIVNSIIGFLKDGKYNDTTGVAFKNTSPQTNNDSNNQQNITCNRNMNKKLIRLTESDLHRIVSEAVNKVLMEASGLDPRTTASAAEKARMRGQYDRAKMFKNASVDSWNEKFGNSEAEGWESEFIDPRSYDGTESLGNGEPYIASRRTDGERGNNYRPSNSKHKLDTRSFWSKNGNEPSHFTTPMSRGEKVASQMVRGNGEYIKGKGWKD